MGVVSSITPMMLTFELPLNHEGRLQKIARPKLSKYGIYVIRLEQDVIRIGESSSGVDRIVKGLREPLRRILRGKDRKNYLAYHWRSDFSNMSIHADYFELNDDQFSDNHLRRALEAEVTFQFRLAMQAWPRCMSEIHFLERCRQNEHLVLRATELLSHYELQYKSV
jgi:hypothetical protein